MARARMWKERESFWRDVDAPSDAAPSAAKVRVAKWFYCGLRGLSARRFSPGIGIRAAKARAGRGADECVGAEGFFELQCANDSGAGACGDAAEKANFALVQDWLESRRSRMRVYEAESADGLLRGECSGAWFLGSAGGAEIGSVVWYPEGHVATVVDVDGRLAAGVSLGATGAAPWLRSIAGAPKRSAPKKKAAAKSKRGAHLRGAQNPNVMAGVAARERRATGEDGAPSSSGEDMPVIPGVTVDDADSGDAAGASVLRRPAAAVATRGRASGDESDSGEDMPMLPGVTVEEDDAGAARARSDAVAPQASAARRALRGAASAAAPPSDSYGEEMPVLPGVTVD
ncbi:unnamed protein product, partial [Prorocentrum cordatum]